MSQQTVARRYQRLYQAGLLRVIGEPGTRQPGAVDWLVRLTGTPGSTRRLAEALSARDDTSWVQLALGGTEIICNVRIGPGDLRGSLLLQDLPRARAVTAISAHCVLRLYFGNTAGWSGRTSALTDEQIAQLTGRSDSESAHRLSSRQDLPAGVLAEQDVPLLEALRRDGRMSYPDLARVTGWSLPTVRRRLAGARASGAIVFDVDVDERAFGYHAHAVIWLSVIPSQLDRAATAMSEHPEVTVVASTTGPTNLVAHALCRDVTELHRYITVQLGALRGVRAIETAPILETIKRSGPPPHRP